MAKLNNGNSEVDSKAPPTGLEGAVMNAPSAMRNASTSSDGFWDEKAGYPVYGKLLFAREVTPKRGPSSGKRKRYYVVELAAPTMLLANEDRGQPAKPAKKGDIIGVWATPGIADMMRLAGCTIFLKLNPEKEWKDVGKGNPMKTYEFKFTGEGRPVKVVPFNEDTDGAQGHTGDNAPDGAIPF